MLTHSWSLSREVMSSVWNLGKSGLIHSWSLSREVMSILWNLAKCGHTDILSNDEGAFEAAATRVALAATVNVD